MRRRLFATVLVGQNAFVRAGLTRILRAAGFRIVASTSSVSSLDIGSLQQDQPVLLILDAGNDPHAIVEQITTFKNQLASGHVAVLTDRYQLKDMISAFRAGASSYFVKVDANDAFIKSLELIMLGEILVPPAVLPFILDQDVSSEEDLVVVEAETMPSLSLETEKNRSPQLSVREESVLRCLIEGHTNKVIARKTDIAEATVKVHVKAILRKIRVHNRTQAAIWAINNGLLATATRQTAHPSPQSRAPRFSADTSMVEPVGPAGGVNHVELPKLDNMIRVGVKNH